MSQIQNDPTTPDSSMTLTDEDIKRILDKVSRELGAHREQYPHFKQYDGSKAVSTLSIQYKHGITYKPVQGKKTEIKQEKNGPALKKHIQLEEIAVFSETDGIDLRIDLTSYQDYKQTTRVWIPDLWIRDHAVEISVRGANTEDITSIRKKVKEVLLLIKRQEEKGKID